MIILTASLWEQTVGSRQVQQTCMSIRGKAVVPTGENTEVHEAILGHLENGPALEELSPHVHRHGLYVHEGGPHLRSATCCWTVRCHCPV